MRIIKDKEAIEEDYQKALELFFAYGYGCCVFKCNICGDQSEVPDGMLDFVSPLPPGFFMSPRCPLVRESSIVAATKVHHGEAVEEPKRSAPARDLNGTS